VNTLSAFVLRGNVTDRGNIIFILYTCHTA
jgi:hypothetical protein